MSGSNTSIRIGPFNDILLDNNSNLMMAVGKNAVKQDCVHAIATQLGEMFLQPNNGLPTLTTVWLSRNLVQWESVARKTLNTVPGVVRVVAFAASFAGNQLNYNATILTAYSRTLVTINGVLDNPT